jgi:hypothetical protein
VRIRRSHRVTHDKYLIQPEARSWDSTIPRMSNSSMHITMNLGDRVSQPQPTIVQHINMQTSVTTHPAWSYISAVLPHPATMTVPTHYRSISGTIKHHETCPVTSSRSRREINIHQHKGGCANPNYVGRSGEPVNDTTNPHGQLYIRPTSS